MVKKRKIGMLPYTHPDFVVNNVKKASNYLVPHVKRITKNTIDREIMRAKKSQRGQRYLYHDFFPKSANNMTDF